MCSTLIISWSGRLTPPQYRRATHLALDALAAAGLDDGLTIRTDGTTAGHDDAPGADVAAEGIAG